MALQSSGPISLQDIENEFPLPSYTTATGGTILQVVIIRYTPLQAQALSRLQQLVMMLQLNI